MSEKIIIPGPGDLIAGKYEIESELGRGAYGVVYKAKQAGIGRWVALKTLLPQVFLEGGNVVERFEREAAFVGRLDHRNIVTVYDFGQHDDLLYMAVEFVDGRSLAELIWDEAPLQVGRVRNIAYQILAALEHAHARGIIHRDLKPGNILVTDPPEGSQDELVKILDFGIAKMLAEAEEEQHADKLNTLTKTGTVLGTPHYMSPESITGDPLSHNSDLYSLGVMIYEMLTGERPFDGKNSAAVMVAHLRDDPPRLPAHLDKTCWGEALRALMVKQPDDRIQTPAEVRAILDRADDPHPDDVPPDPLVRTDPATTETLSERLTEMGRERRGLVWAIVILLGAIAGLAGFVLLQTDQPVDPDQPPDAVVEEDVRVELPKVEIAAEEPPTVDHHDEAAVADDQPPDVAAEPAPDAPTAPGQAAHPTVEATPPAEQPALRPEPEPKRTPPAKRPRPEAPTAVTLRIQTSPPDARVTIDGSPVGSTPLSREVRAGDEPLTLRFSLIGFRDKTVQVVPDRNRTVDVRLDKARIQLMQ